MPEPITIPQHPYRKKWKALYRGKWYRVIKIRDIGPYNVYVLEGVREPVPQNLVQDIKTAASFKEKILSRYRGVS